MDVRTKGSYEIAHRELVAEGADLRVQVLTLAAGQSVPWHYHSEITDSIVCLEGRTVVETRARTVELPASERALLESQGVLEHLRQVVALLHGIAFHTRNAAQRNDLLADALGVDKRFLSTLKEQRVEA